MSDRTVTPPDVPVEGAVSGPTRERPARGHRRGHRLIMSGDRRWRWAESGRYAAPQRLPEGDPDCIACGLPPTPEGYDACLGRIEGADAACCGHGVVEPYVKWSDGRIERGAASVEAGVRFRDGLGEGNHGDG